LKEEQGVKRDIDTRLQFAFHFDNEIKEAVLLFILEVLWLKLISNAVHTHVTQSAKFS